MRIVFLGASHGLPEPGRRCSSAMIEIGENRYFIDMGCQVIEDLATRGISIETVRAVFVTHMHGDHTDGLLSFVDLCNWYYKAAKPVFCLPGDVEQTKAGIDGWLRCNGKEMREFDFRSISDGFVYDDGTVKITAFRTKHTAASFGYFVEAEGKRVYFGGDLSSAGPGNDFPTCVLERPLDLAICEGAHFDTTQYVPIFKDKETVKKVCFNHYSDRFLASILETTRMLSPIPVIRATDNLEINI